MKNRTKPLWSDRLRHLGLPLSFTHYVLTEERLLVTSGFLSIHGEDLALWQVQDIRLQRSFCQRLFGLGSLLLQTADPRLPSLELRNIAHPREVQAQIARQVELCKSRPN